METRNTTLDDLASVVGFTAAVRLAVWYGDRKTNLYVPKEITEGHTLVELLGEPAARRLIESFGQEHINVPGLHGVFREARYAEICEQLRLGIGSKEISQKIGITERRVQQLKVEFEKMGVLPMVFGGKNAQQNEG